MKLVGNFLCNAPAFGKSALTGKSPAQRRLHKILEGDQLAIRVTNLRARAGQKPVSITRHLDKLLDRTRRGPRSTR